MTNSESVQTRGGVATAARAMAWGMGLIAGMAIGAGGWGCAASSTRELAGGDGVVTAPTGDHAFEMQFDDITLSQPGEYVFEFGQLPPTDMHALLSVVSPGPDVARVIDRAGVNVRTELMGVVSSSQPNSYQLRDGLLEGEWIKTSRSYNAEPLEYVAMWFKPRRHERFAMKMVVSIGRPGALEGQTITATPMLRGGRPLQLVPMHRGSEFVGSP